MPTQIDLPEQADSVDASILAEGAESPAGPTIEFVPSEDRVRITGTMWVGNPCHEARLGSLRYDGRTDELDVLVVVEKVRSNCPDSLGTDTYEVVITMRSRLPESVNATQRDFEGGSETETASPT